MTSAILSASAPYAWPGLTAASIHDGTSITSMGRDAGASPVFTRPVGSLRPTPRDESLLEIQVVAPRSDCAHGLETVGRHVAIQLDAVAVGIREIHAPGHVVLDRGLHRHADRLQLLVGGPELLEAPELPRHVVQAGLCRARGLAGRELEEGQVMMFLAEAQEHRAPLEVLVGHLQPERPGVKIPRLPSIADLQHDMTEFPCLNHGDPPAGQDVGPTLSTAYDSSSTARARPAPIACI